MIQRRQSHESRSVRLRRAGTDAPYLTLPTIEVYATCARPFGPFDSMVFWLAAWRKEAKIESS
jgi:hypothetical protein